MNLVPNLRLMRLSNTVLWLLKCSSNPGPRAGAGKAAGLGGEGEGVLVKSWLLLLGAGFPSLVLGWGGLWGWVGHVLVRVMRWQGMGRE